MARKSRDRLEIERRIAVLEDDVVAWRHDAEMFADNAKAAETMILEFKGVLLRAAETGEADGEPDEPGPEDYDGEGSEPDS